MLNLIFGTHNCVEVCPVDCFYKGETMLAIDLDVCIDCGVCEPECPAEAIKSDTARDAEAWVQFNRDKSHEWPNITAKGTPLADADQWIGVERTFESVFGVPQLRQIPVNRYGLYFSTALVFHVRVAHVEFIGQ